MFLLPVVDRLIRVDLRTVTLTIAPQEVITRDNAPARVNAVAYFRVVDPVRAITEVEAYPVATSQIAQTMLGSVLGRADLDTLLSERDELNDSLCRIIDEQTEPWGIKVTTSRSGTWRSRKPNVNGERKSSRRRASSRRRRNSARPRRCSAATQPRYQQTLVELGGDTAGPTDVSSHHRPFGVPSVPASGVSARCSPGFVARVGSQWMTTSVTVCPCGPTCCTAAFNERPGSGSRASTTSRGVPNSFG